MNPFSLRNHIAFSYRTYFRLLSRTFFSCRRTQARPTARRLLVMAPFSLALLVLQTFHWLGFVLDEIFFPGYRRVEVRRPLFVVGVPRSGTTFLHRFLAKDKDRFTTFTTWELIFAPSITERRLVLFLSALDRILGSPLARITRGLERLACGGLDEIHAISLSEPEEDYFLLAPIYACFLMILPFPFPEELGYLAFFDDQAPADDRDRVMAFYRSCLQRHLYVHGPDKTLLSKNVSFAPMVRALDKAFPDCGIIGTVRDPRLAVPSHISSMMTGAALFDNDVRGKTFRDQMIDVQVYAFAHLAEVLPGMPGHRQMIVKMEDLQTDLRRTVRGIYDRLGYPMTPAFEAFLTEQDRKQKTYRSRHVYDLSSYGLSGEEIDERFADVYGRYGYSKPAPLA